MSDEYVKDFDAWNDLKKSLHVNDNPPRHFQRREVWWCALGVNLGYEEDGKHANFERPVVIVRKLTKDLFMAVPLTTTIREGDFFFNLPDRDGDGRPEQVILAQARVLSAKRLLRYMYRISPQQFADLQSKMQELIFQSRPSSKNKISAKKSKSQREAGKSRGTNVRLHGQYSKDSSSRQAQPLQGVKSYSRGKSAGVAHTKSKPSSDLHKHDNRVKSSSQPRKPQRKESN